MSQGKFSEIPYYLIDEYYSNINLYTAGDVREVNIEAGYLTFVDTDIMAWDSNEGYIDWDGKFNYLGADVANSGLRGMEISINTNGSAWSSLYAKIPSVGFKKVKLKQFPDDTWKEENTLHFEISQRPENTAGIFTVGEDPGFEWEETYEHVWIDDKRYAVIAKKVDTTASSFTIYKQKLLSNASTVVDPGTEIYFRKDSAFHFWFRKFKKYEKTKGVQRSVVNSDVWNHEDFINDRVIYLYFGKIYNNIKSSTWKNIQYYSLKDFAINILPENNQTTMYKKWLWESYDKAHFEQWNVQKNIPTLLDADEIALKYLGYLSKFYGYDIDTNIIEEERQRLLVKSLIYQLKRKGAWTGILTAWRVLSGNTLNRLNLYELWHPTEIFKRKVIEELVPRKGETDVINFDMKDAFDNGLIFNNTNDMPVVKLDVDVLEGKLPFRVRVEAVLDNGDFTDVSWDFGNGSTIKYDVLQGTYTYFIYTVPGEYTITQTVTDKNFGDIVLRKNVKVLETKLYSTLSFRTNRPDLLGWKLDYADVIWHTDLSIELPVDSYKIYLKPAKGYEFENFYTIDLDNDEIIDVIYKEI